MVQVEKKPGQKLPVVCIILDADEVLPEAEEIKVMLMTAGMAMGYHINPESVVRLDTSIDDNPAGHGRVHS